MTSTTHVPSTQKVRREIVGGKRAEGHRLQRQGRRVRRPDAGTLTIGQPDPRVTGVGGLVDFGAFVRQLGVDRELRRRFGHLKSHGNVVYPMHAQLRLLVDAHVAGASRVFGVEALAADPVFHYLAGGAVPSVDTIYDDLQRFNFQACWDLEEVVGDHGLAALDNPRKRAEVHIDIDTTVMPVFGEQEGALPGPNPHYHGRPSFHPLIARLAETDTVIGAEFREGNTGFGASDADFVVRNIDRVRRRVGPHALIYVRIDGAADCTAILGAIADRGALFITKARMTADLCGTIACIPATQWRTVELDAEDRPFKQVAEIDFHREEWRKAGRKFRVFAVRTRDKLTGKQIGLWKNEIDMTAQAFITNDVVRDADDLAQRYDLRAGIEPLIGELKGCGIGKVSSQHFYANSAGFLLKLLAFNLTQRWVANRSPKLLRWRSPWIRRALVHRPGRLLRSGGRRLLRLAPRPLLE